MLRMWSIWRTCDVPVDVEDVVDLEDVDVPVDVKMWLSLST